MDKKELIQNISLLLGAQQVQFIDHNSKDLDLTKNNKRVQILSKGFNIYSLRLDYNYVRRSIKVNLRRKLKIQSQQRTMLLPVLLTNKRQLTGAINELNDPNIHSMEFTTNLYLSTEFIEGEGIVPITLFGHTLYINYNEDSDFQNYKITKDELNISRLRGIMSEHRTATPFDKYNYNKPHKYYDTGKLTFGDAHEHLGE